MGDYLKFDKFITPTIVQIIWWIGNLGLVLFLLGGLSEEYTNKGAVLVTFLAGAVGWRIYCELVLLFFKIYDRLGDNRNS